MDTINLNNKQVALMCGCLLGWPLISLVCTVLFSAGWLAMGLFAALCLGNAIYGTTKAYTHLKRGQFVAVALTAAVTAGWGIFLILQAV